MEFLDPDKKKSHHRRLFVGYFLVAILIGFASLLLVYLSYGYTIDRKTGQVIQNGLTFLGASPEPADIYINGILRGATDVRLSLPAGQYKIELKRDGYRSWQHDLNLEGGRIERLVYPKLFPSELAASDVQLYAHTPLAASQSPNRRWLVVAQPGQFGVFDIFDTRDPAILPEVATVPASIMTASAQDRSLEPVEWADNNRHLLLLHSFSGGREFLLFDRENPAASTNLSSTFKLPAATDVRLREKKHDQYYFHNTIDKTLVSAELRTVAVEPAANSVLAFKDYEPDALLYVTSQGAPAGKAHVRLLDATGDYLLRTINQAAAYPIDIARYDGSWYVALAVGEESKTYIYKNPAQTLRNKPDEVLVPISVLKVDAANKISFSDNTQFVLAAAGNRFGVYDIENDRRFQYETKLAITAGTKAAWMDGYRLAMLSGGKAAVFDFDGTNIQLLSEATYLPFFSGDYNLMYAIAPSVVVPGRSALTVTDLNIGN